VGAKTQQTTRDPEQNKNKNKNKTKKKSLSQESKYQKPLSAPDGTPFSFAKQEKGGNAPKSLSPSQKKIKKPRKKNTHRAIRKTAPRGKKAGRLPNRSARLGLEWGSPVSLIATPHFFWQIRVMREISLMSRPDPARSGFEIHDSDRSRPFIFCFAGSVL
jgi:hypothetical protein